MLCYSIASALLYSNSSLSVCRQVICFGCSTVGLAFPLVVRSFAALVLVLVLSCAVCSGKRFSLGEYCAYPAALQN